VVEKQKCISTTPHFIGLPLPSHETVSILPLFVIILLDFEAVTTVGIFLFPRIKHGILIDNGICINYHNEDTVDCGG
jgi:hypothetical protein